MDRKQTNQLTRRHFNRRLSATIAVTASIPLGTLLATLPRAAGAANVKESAPHAKALKYASQSAKAGQNCANCTMYEKGSKKQIGHCPLFNGETVLADAWCSAWVPRS